MRQFNASVFIGMIMLAAGASLAPTGQAQTLLNITAPGNQNILQEGQVYNVTITVDPSVQNVAVLSEFPVPDPEPTSDATQFTLSLPTTIPPGYYHLTAVGTTSAGEVESDPISVDIERGDDPVQLWAEPLLISFKAAGDQQPILVYGTYADGTRLIISKSTKIGYLSTNSQIARVAATGLGFGIVTAVAPGQAAITVQAGPSLYFPISVTVAPPAPTGPAPIITSVAPTIGTPGQTQVTVTGSNFGATQGTGTLQLGTDSAPITSWSDSQIVATVPLGSMPGLAEVVQNGQNSNQVPFTTIVPAITTVSPSTGTPGTPVTISGSNFGAAPGASTVTFNRGTATPTSWSDSSIVTTVPANATTGTIVVLVNGTPSNGFDFTVPPNIASLAPNPAAVGAPVTITGGGFGIGQGSNTVTFNGVAASPTSWAASSITSPVPAGSSTGNVVVTINGVPSNAQNLTVLPPPTINTIAPGSGPVGTSVTIAGANFGAVQGTSTVAFNGAAATAASWSDASISATVPAAASTGNVIVHANGVDSNSIAFTVIPSPTITTLSPTSGALGTLVTITGTNFGSTPGTSTVTFNGTLATSITSWGATSIKASVPTGATTGNVVVTVSGAVSNGKAFTVGPSITSLSPTSGPVGTTVTITGTNFGATKGSSTVKFNGKTATTIPLWSATSIQAKVPSGATTGNVVVTVGGIASNGKTFTVH